MARAKPVEFRLYAPQAKCVNLAGSFNGWDTKTNNTKKDSKGNWSTKVSLEPGKHEYKFFVDGAWWNDPNCAACKPNAFGSQNCVIEVKQAQ